MNPHSYSTGGSYRDTHHQAHPNADPEKQCRPPSGLSQQLNAAIREGHDVVNNLIMSRLALGLQDHTLYREGILSFTFVYKTFEEEWTSLISSNSNTDPRIKSALQRLYATPLLRTSQLTNDLRYYFGSTPFSIEAPTTIQRTACVSHIRQAIAERPHVLIAYAYNYYMALFAGGKVLRYQISKAKGFFPECYGMTEEERIMAGTNLFSFEVKQGKADGLRTSFKETLSDLECILTAEEKHDIIEESRTIFFNNILLIEELDQICAYLVATSPRTSLKVATGLGEKYKFLAFVAILTFFFIARNIVK